MARKAMGAGLDTLIPKTNVEGTENKNKEIIKESNTISEEFIISASQELKELK